MLPPSCEDFRARFEPRDGTVLPHRRQCRACALWAARLEAFLTPSPPRPLPARLRSRLLAIAVSPPIAAPPILPWWIRDGSAALAASLLLAVGFSLLVDVRWIATSAAHLGAGAVQVLEIGDAKRRAAADELSRAVDQRRSAVSQGVELLSVRFFEIRDFVRQEASELYEHAASLTSLKDPLEGDDDGKS